MTTPCSTDPEGTAFVIRNAEPAKDGDTLYSLFKDARLPELASLGWDDQRLDALLRTQFEAQRSDYVRRFPGAEQRIALLGDEPVALLWVWRSDQQIRLLDFIVAASHRNAGIGTALLVRLQAEAFEASLPLRHMVAVNNDGARRLYERLGFAVVSDAGSHLVMEWLPGPIVPGDRSLPEAG